MARPFVLARTLDSHHFEITFARPDTFAWLTAEADFRIAELDCQDAAVFARRLDHGLPLYDYPTLARYVEDDLALIDRETPDIIIGDFRLSLSVSARLRHVPYITICDAYWSPERPLRAPLPVLGFTRFMPIPIAELIFRCVSGLALPLHAIPMERLRARYGIPSLGFDLRRCYTDADLCLFANFPALYTDVHEGASAAFVGPIAWSPNGKELDFLDAGTPVIYVTMGSSGNPAVLAALLPILDEAGHHVVVATAGKSIPSGQLSHRIRVFDYLPGDIVCQRAALVVCNGGSPTTNQALANGIPVLGIARNMDQFLNMRAICEFGAGLLLRADRADEAALKRATTALLANPRYAERARILARSTSANGLTTKLTEVVEQLLSHRRARSA